MNRKYVGKVVFSDPKEKKRWTVSYKIRRCPDHSPHGRVSEAGRGRDAADKSKGLSAEKVIFYDHPLLFEIAVQHRGRQMRRGWWMWMMRPEYSAF